MTNEDIWMQFHSVADWTVPAVWEALLASLEGALGDKLLRLDENDPVRRQAAGLSDSAAYIARFAPAQHSKSCFGKFKKSGITIEINLYRGGRDSFGRARDNTFLLVMPARVAASMSDGKSKEVFLNCVDALGPYYAYAARPRDFASRKFATLSWDPSRELLGVFWLTYFDRRYVQFFGEERFAASEEAQTMSGGRVVQVGHTVGEYDTVRAREIERNLGAQSFAGEIAVEKAPGQFALRVEDMLLDSGA